MNFALLGGDDRFARLARLLRTDGHTVTPFALEKALPDCVRSAAEALTGADCAVLPLPAEKGGRLNAPLSAGVYAISDILSAARPGMPVCAGAAGDALRDVCARRGLPLYDYGRREDFALRNADLTAEGAIALLLDALPKALRDSRVLICGYGRIGRRLARKLPALGASVTVAARGAAARAEAALDGCETVTMDRAPAPGYDVVVNTIPAPVFGAAEIATFGPARLLELASAPGGFDRAAAEELGKTIRAAPGLPGKFSPESAAEAVKASIYAILEEQ